MVRYRDINKILSKEFNIEENHVKLIIHDFWLGMKRYITNPLEAINGITIPNFLCFYINFKKVQKKHDDYSLYLEEENCSEKLIDSINVLKKLLDVKRQTSEKLLDEGSSE